MKVQKLASLFMLTLLLPLASVAHTDHGSHHNGEMVMECMDPDRTVAIAADPNQNLYNTTELQAEKGECLMIMFMNMAPIMEHDFHLENATGGEWVHMHLLNKTHDPYGVGEGMAMAHIQLPDEDSTFDFYCTIAGHRDAGMEGVLIVGEGSSGQIPGFEFSALILGFITLFIARFFVLRRQIDR